MFQMAHQLKITTLGHTYFFPDQHCFLEGVPDMAVFKSFRRNLRSFSLMKERILIKHPSSHNSATVLAFI